MLEKHELQYVASAAVRKRESARKKSKSVKIPRAPSKTEDCGNASSFQSTSVQEVLWQQQAVFCV